MCITTTVLMMLELLVLFYSVLITSSTTVVGIGVAVMVEGSVTGSMVEGAIVVGTGVLTMSTVVVVGYI